MKQNEILFFLASVCIVVFAWIAFTILHNSLTSTISGTVLQAISPIDPTFNTTTISQLSKRTVVNPIFVIQPQSTTNVVVTGTLLPTPLPSPIASSSAQIASQGGTLQ